MDDSGAELFVAYPFFLPDGRHYLVRCLRAEPAFEDRGICVASLDSDRARTVVDARTSVSRAEDAPPGYLLYLRGETLLAHPFDAGELRVDGDPVALAETVDLSGPVGLANFSVSTTGVLTYQVGPPPTRLLAHDREGRLIEEVGVPADYYDMRLSPDGRKLATSRLDRNTQAGDIWIIELARNVATRFTTTDPEREAFIPVWSPDGTRIVFCEAANAPPFLHVKSLAGGEAEVLLPSRGTLQCPSDWSPDGDFILYHDRDPTRQYDLWLLPMTGEDREPRPFAVTRFNEMLPVFSPDGRWVAFVSDESGREEVYVQPFRRAGQRRRISTSGGTLPRWRRDGRELFYLSNDEQLVAVPIEPGENLEPGTPRPLFAVGRRPSLLRTYDVSPDGERFIVMSPAAEASPQPVVVIDWAAELAR